MSWLSQFIAAQAVFLAMSNLGLRIMRRAAVSVASNIVEGCARDSLPEYIRFLDIAHGSAHELEYQVTLATRLNYIASDEAVRLSNLAIETCKVLNALLRALRSEHVHSSRPDGLQPVS